MEKYQVWHVYYDKEMVGQFLVPVGAWVDEEHYMHFLPEGYDSSKVSLSYSGSVTIKEEEVEE